MIIQQNTHEFIFKIIKNADLYICKSNSAQPCTIIRLKKDFHSIFMNCNNLEKRTQTKPGSQSKNLKHLITLSIVFTFQAFIILNVVSQLLIVAELLFYSIKNCIKFEQTCSTNYSSCVQDLINLFKHKIEKNIKK